MSDQPSVVAAMAAVMEEVRAVTKGDRNQQQGYSFRGIDAVVNAVGPALRKHKVVVVPMLEEVHYRDVQTSTGKPSRECTVTVRYRFHGPAGDHLDCVAPGESMDFGDKGAPKAMSVAYRIALLQALCLPTTDTDPDAESYERAIGSGQASRHHQPRNGASAKRQSSPADEARSALRSVCEREGWDTKRAAQVFATQHGEPLGETQDADKVKAFMQALIADPDHVLGAAPAGA